MDAELQALLDRFQADLKHWLDQPSPATRTIDQLRAKVGELRNELGAGLLADTLRDLDRATGEARRHRQRQAADAIAKSCKGQGVHLEPHDPSKRPAKKPGTAKTPAAPKKGDHAAGKAD